MKKLVLFYAAVLLCVAVSCQKEECTTGNLNIKLTKAEESLASITVSSAMEDHESYFASAVSIDDATEFSLTLPAGNYEKITLLDTDGAIAVLRGDFTVTAGGSLNLEFSSDIHFAVKNEYDGLYWSKTNLGAETASEHGHYFAWGYTEPYEFDEHSGEWKTVSDGTVVKFNSQYFPHRNPSTFEDPAAAAWGGTWHMPTLDDFINLYNENDNDWDTDNGIPGTKFFNLPIFIPITGCALESELLSADEGGYYWTTTMVGTGSEYPFILMIVPMYDLIDVYDGRTDYGFSVRPVCTEL